MEYQKMTNLFNKMPNQPSKFRTKNWIEINEYARETHNKDSQIKKDKSKVFLKIRRNRLAKFRDSHGGCQGEKLYFEDLDCWKMPFPDSFMTINVSEIH